MISKATLELAVEALVFEERRMDAELKAGRFLGLEKQANARIRKLWDARWELITVLTNGPEPVQEPDKE
ncbi:MAG: hypothetical protein WC565_08350 [Parcubacteria group bacterium]